MGLERRAKIALQALNDKHQEPGNVGVVLSYVRFILCVRSFEVIRNQSLSRR